MSNNTDAAAASASSKPATTTVVAGDNKSSTRVELSALLSPTPLPPTGSTTAYALAHLKAGALPTAAGGNGGVQTTQRPLHLCIVVDTSGSMGGQKISLAQQAMNFVVNEMRAIDSVGIVAFSDRVTVSLPMTATDERGKLAATQAVTKLRAGGSTFLSGGLFAGLSLVTGDPIDMGPSSGDDSPAYGGNRRSARGGWGGGHHQPVSVFHHPGFPSGGVFPPGFPSGGVFPPGFGGPGGFPPGAFGGASVLQSAQPFGTAVNNIAALASSSASSSSVPSIKAVTAEVSHTFTHAAPTSSSADSAAQGAYRYKLRVNSPHEVVKFTVRDPEPSARFADIHGSGDSEFDLKPLNAALASVEIAFEFAGSAAPHKITYFLGEVPSGKRTLQIPTQSLPRGSISPGDTPPQRSPRSSSDVQRVVLLLTDGQASSGLATTPELVRELRHRLHSASKDATVFCCGFGADHNAEMLKEISSTSEGMFYYCAQLSAISEIFADLLAGCLSVVAQQLTVTCRLEPGSGIRFGTPMTKLRYTVADDGNSIAVRMKDMQAEEARDILLELKVDGTTAKSNLNGVKLFWSVEFTDALSTAGAATAPTRIETAVNVPIDGNATPVVNNEVDAQVQRWVAINAMEQVRAIADSGDLARARQTAQQYSAQFAAAPSSSTSTTTNIRNQMDELCALTADQGRWQDMGSKQSCVYAQQQQMQRCNDFGSNNGYAGNALRSEMRSKAAKK